MTSTLARMDPSAAETAAGRRAALWRLGLYGVALGTIFTVALLFGAIPSAAEARRYGDDLGPFAAVAYVPLFAVANFVVAWAILAGAGGLLFGTLVAWPLALAGVTLAAARRRWPSLAGWRGITRASCSRSRVRGSRSSCSAAARSR